MAGAVGIEPTTSALTVHGSAAELHAKNKWSGYGDSNPR
jgi:hypothetical protein